MEKSKFLDDSDNESHNDDESETGDLNVWKLLLDELKNEEEEVNDRQEVFEKLRCYILLCRSLKRDKIFRSVMEMVRENMYEAMIDPLEFEEALSYTIDKKVQLFLRLERRQRSKALMKTFAVGSPSSHFQSCKGNRSTW